MENPFVPHRVSPPAVILIAVNLIPVFGVVFGGWSLLEVVALYWLENVIIGAINVLKMATCAPDLSKLLQSLRPGSLTPGTPPKTNISPFFPGHGTRPKPPRSPGSPSATSGHAADEGDLANITTAGHHLMKLFFIPFFTIHYGMFCLVHGVFIFVLLGGDHRLGGHRGPFGALREEVADMLSGGTLLAAVALAGSHLFSYFYYFLYQGEYRRTNLMQLMGAPYGRVVVLHLAILFGAFATHLLGQPIVLLLLLVAGKTTLDWTMHQVAHRPSPSDAVLSTHGTDHAGQ
jgi:hypothetical protein